jgi:hypothetical protein
MNMKEGIALARKALNLLRADPILSRYPLYTMAGYAVIALLMLMFISGYRVFDNLNDGRAITIGQQFGVLLIFIVFYILNYMVSTVANAALISAAIIRFGGEEPTIRDGFRLALKRLPALMGYAALSATIGLIARPIAEFSKNKKDNIALDVVGAIVGTSVASAWNILTYLALPVIVVERLNLFASMRRSADLFRQLIGDEASGLGPVSILAVLVAVGAAIPGCLLTTIGAAMGSGFIATLGFLLLFLLAGFVTLMGGAVNSLLQASLYLSAVENQTGTFFDEADLLVAFGGAQAAQLPDN